jgi:adenine-specific DNA-methyltransferase
LIQGDSLNALKALLPFYRGQVKCILIDLLYNTQRVGLSQQMDAAVR